MNYFAKTILFLVFATSLGLYSDNIVILTIPKSGTNLLSNTIWLITNQEITLGKMTTLGNHCVYFDHVVPGVYNLENSSRLAKVPNSNAIQRWGIWKKVILIRDPRDSLVSLTYWEERKSAYGHTLNTQELEAFQSLSKNQQITSFINRPKNLSGIPYFLDLAFYWMNHDDVILIRFEDLIGPKGGGSALKQRETIAKLGELFGYELTESQITNIANELFGNSRSSTFRKGMIGSWKDEFNEYHKLLFKEKMGSALILLGYESNFDW